MFMVLMIFAIIWIIFFFAIALLYKKNVLCNEDILILDNFNIIEIFWIDCNFMQIIYILINKLYLVFGDTSSFLLSGIALLTSVTAIFYMYDYLKNRKLLREIKNREIEIQSDESILKIINQIIDEFKHDAHPGAEIVRNAKENVENKIEKKREKLEKLKEEQKYRKQFISLLG